MSPTLAAASAVQPSGVAKPYLTGTEKVMQERSGRYCPTHPVRQ